MLQTILFVDDEPNILSAFRRQLHGRYELETANGGAAGLEKIASSPPFAVIVSDLRMPGMDGVHFLARAKELAPDSVRMMLTGHADLDTAVQAINEGSIFRFLTKPCPPEQLVMALEAALQQHRLITAERELLEKTLSNSIKLLTEMLSLASPLAFSRALRVRKVAGRIAGQLKLLDAWQVELAATLSQIGCITLPADLLDKLYRAEPLSKSEQSLFDSHPAIGARLLAKISRLEAVAEMIAGQHRHYVEYAALPRLEAGRKTHLGAQILKAALDYDRLAQADQPHAAAVEQLRQRVGDYNPNVLDALAALDIAPDAWEVRLAHSETVEAGMIADEEIRGKDGTLFASKGQEFTQAMMEKLENLAKGSGVIEPFRVLAPRALLRGKSEAEA